MINKAQTEYLLPKAYNAALRAGAAILEIYDSGEQQNIDLKSDLTPITLADRRAHAVIREYLAETRIPLLSEEGRELLYAERKPWDLYWMVDPLDGTKEFLKGNGEFTVNIALMVDNKPAFGVVYVPYKSRMYFSDPALGAFRSCSVAADASAELEYSQLFERVEMLPVTAARNEPLRVAVSRSHNTKETYAHIEEMKKDFPGLEIMEQGSSYKFCLIAEGTVDYYVRTSDTYEWDTAAGDAVLEAAGGQTLSLPGQTPLQYNQESLVNPHFACRSKWFR